MDSITFEIGDYTIQLVNGRALFWVGVPNSEPAIDIDLKQLQSAISTAGMLIK